MTIEVDGTIVYVKDRWAASRDVADVLGCRRRRPTVRSPS